MENTINYYPTANWAVLNGAFTPDDLKDIINKIQNPELQKEVEELEEDESKED